MDFLNQGKQVASQQSLTSYQATSSNLLGLIYPTNLDTTADLGYFRADKNFNNPIYLSRPRQNYFNVLIVNKNNPPTIWTDSATTLIDLPQYVLILSFEECD